MTGKSAAQRALGLESPDLCVEVGTAGEGKGGRAVLPQVGTGREQWDRGGVVRLK